ncbi:MAG: CRISPR-associated helicase Cas3' [Betaproteobacteria bacterium]|nr:CRISPR-associated helicase Cas3' [Betaproteobacteria bacterium]MBK7458724.1 CRISPR-associated helicase Cas3' [Betaproteobacteria bacterium]MBL0299672.1 CRISPR-associated helicase Cas3' [Betaproteobacteria bacterium]MBP6316489.1 CRISPR-associated helicase Cas3' [Rubrivivax sp.]
MRFDSLSPAARAIWAKSADPSGHGLLAHMLDVSAVAEQLLALESPQTLAWAADVFGLPSHAAARWLATMVGLHDLGKAIPGFQAKWPQGREADIAAGLSFHGAELAQDQHDLASAVELKRLLAPWSGSAQRAAAIAGAVAAHHGHVFESSTVNNARRPGESAIWKQARRELFDAYIATLAPAPTDSDDDIALPALTWLAGLTSMCDWIGSNTEWFLPGERDATFTGHHRQALALADAALQAIGWPSFSPLLQPDQAGAGTDELVARIVGQVGLAARPLQAAADRLTKSAAGPQLLIVEAPMGEGKTELALLAHLRLQAALGHRGLFIGLPTQATGNAMFARTLRFLQAFGSGIQLDIQLAHGGVLVPDALLRLRGIHGERGDTVRSSAWFSQRRRPLISPYGVGTLDQALLATLNVKHHFVRLWGLANRVVVLDEVHAYDTYTSGLIEALLRWLKALHCSVVLMSATLPAARRDSLLRAWSGSTVDLPKLPYPRVLAADATGVRPEYVASRPLASIELRAIDEELESMAAAAEAAARRGGCGAIIVNTVDRAQRLYVMLKARLHDLLQPQLFHARFPADERQQHENAVLATFGRDAFRPPVALLVATQVVEQSLDIDFDWLISDLAPVDLLLQRAGRLHRHERVRPSAHVLPVFTIAGLQVEHEPELKTTRWGLIYDEYVLYRSWAFASRESRWQLPQDIDRMVQTVYGDTGLPPGLPEATVRKIEISAQGKHLAEVDRERLLAKYAAIDARSTLQEAYVGLPRGKEDGDFGNRNVTRLGPESLVVVPVHTDDGAWRLHAGDPGFDPGAPPDQGVASRIVQRQLRLSRHDVVKALRETDPLAGWAEHPWLRHVKVLPLVAGTVTLGQTTIRLDLELGIIYGTAKPESET